MTNQHSRGMATLINDLRACIDRFRATNEPHELEIRCGWCLDASGARTTSAQNASFVAEIDPDMFYATFHALYDRAAIVSEPRVTRHARYDAFPGLRQEASGDRVAWTHKSRVCVHDVPLTPRWFDVRVSLAHELATVEPDIMKEARAHGERLRGQSKLDNVRSRDAYASLIRARHRRTMQFRDAPAWRVEFTRVHVSTLQLLDAGTGVESRTYMQKREPVYELEIELVDATGDTSALVKQALWVLDTLATAMGPSMAHIRRRLNTDRDRLERRTGRW